MSWRGWKERRRVVGLLRALEHCLAPGDWRLQGSLAWLPAGVDGEPDAYQQRLRDTLLASEGGRVPPPVHVTVRAEGGEPGMDTLIARGVWTLLVERSRNRVLRVTRDAERVQRLLENARWLSSAYRCPRLEPAADLPRGFAGVSESFVEGTPIREAPETVWESAYRDLLQMCGVHARRWEGRFDLDPVRQELDCWTLPHWLSRAVEGHRSRWEPMLLGCPLLASHADCHNGNVFVLPDGSVTLIDLERVQSVPFFFDALSLLRGSAAVNQSLRRAFLAGHFDTALAEVWAAAGQTWDPEGREGALLAMAMAHAFRPQFARASSRKRREKFIGACEKLRADCGWE